MDVTSTTGIHRPTWGSRWRMTSPEPFYKPSSVTTADVGYPTIILTTTVPGVNLE